MPTQKVIHLKVTRVTGLTDSMEPIKESPIIKLKEGREFEKYLKFIPYQGYIKKETEVVKVVEIDGKTQKEVSKDEFSTMLMKAFEANGVKSNKANSYDELKLENEKLLQRLAKLESRFEEEYSIDELRKEYKEKSGKEADKRWKEDKLKEEIEKLK